MTDKAAVTTGQSSGEDLISGGLEVARDINSIFY